MTVVTNGLDLVLGRTGVTGITETRTFEEHLKLEAPATYWQKRARRTFWATMTALFGFTVLAGGFIMGIWQFGRRLVEDLTQHTDIGEFATLTPSCRPRR